MISKKDQYFDREIFLTFFSLRISLHKLVSRLPSYRFWGKAAIAQKGKHEKGRKSAWYYEITGARSEEIERIERINERNREGRRGRAGGEVE